MPSQKKPLVDVRTNDGLWLEWFVRRSELEVSVYRIAEGGTRGGIISKLAYPKIAGIGFSDWTPEAMSIAKRELAEYPDCSHEEAHSDKCSRVEVR